MRDDSRTLDLKGQLRLLDIRIFGLEQFRMGVYNSGGDQRADSREIVDLTESLTDDIYADQLAISQRRCPRLQTGSIYT